MLNNIYGLNQSIINKIIGLIIQEIWNKLNIKMQNLLYEK